MRKIVQCLTAAAVFTLALTVNASAAVKSVTITAPTKSANYTTYVTTKSLTKDLKVSVKTTSKKDSKAVTYKSSNSKIVSITKKGKMKIKKPGVATITVASKKSPKIKDSIKIKVKQGASSILVTTKEGYAIGDKFVITKGRSISTNVIQTPGKASNKVNWTSSNKKVVTVSDKGVIKAVGKGTAKVTAVAKDGCGAKFTTKITVVGAKVTGIKTDKTELTLVKGKSKSVKVTVKTNGNGANTDLLWSSSNTKVATVTQKGKITAIKKGTATITVETIDGSNKKVTIKVHVISSSPEKETTTKSGETTKVDEVTTAKTEETTTKQEETTAKQEETTTKQEETTTKQEETTTKQEETTTKQEETTKKEEETTVPTEKVTKLTVNVDTDKAAKNGITANGTNSIKWDNPEKTFATSSELTNDIVTYLNDNPFGIKFNVKLNGMSLTADGKDYVTKFENNKWKLYDANGKEVDVESTLKNKTIVNFNVKKDTTKDEIEEGLNKLYYGHKNLDEKKTYDFGTGIVLVGADEFKITKVKINTKAHMLELTVNDIEMTVDMTDTHSFIVESEEDISSIKEALESIFTDAVVIE